ncbi:MAG: hypothetical protein K2L13_01555, partial [Opitutales bacterium]|nr:hypothetical protein [Opitutales bacterium]
MSNIAGINNRPPTDVVGFAQDTHGADKPTCVQDEPNLFLSYEKSNIVAIKLSNRLGVDETESIPADQKACLIRYLNDWEKEISRNGPRDYDIATLSNKLARLTKAGINLLPLEGCSPAQRKSIVMYVSQMLECGYKVSFANDVCEMMSKLYQYTTECDGKSVTIESLLSSIKLSDNTDPNMDDETFLEKSEQFKKLRKEIDNDFLPKFMEENGGDYKIMKKYF